MTIEVFAPGRIEILGNHTDYNEGMILSCAIPLGVRLRATKTAIRELRIKTEAFDGQVVAGTRNPWAAQKEGHWSNYPLAVLQVLRDEGYDLPGMNIEISSTVPRGAGLSSSAALEVATAMAALALMDEKVDRSTVASWCRRAENDYVGVQCGLMDQASSMGGQVGSLVFLDCRTEKFVSEPFASNLVFVVMNSGVKHSLVGGEYNERRAQCFEAAKALGAKALRDVKEDQVTSPPLTDVVRRRALHVVTENERVLAAVEAMRAGHPEELGLLMFDSHESSRVNFENSTRELDLLVDIAKEVPGVLGARLTGGGFGGAIVALARRDAAADVRDTVRRRYQDQSGNVSEGWILAPHWGAQVAG